jgi:hypothetical protein
VAQAAQLALIDKKSFFAVYQVIHNLDAKASTSATSIAMLAVSQRRRYVQPTEKLLKSHRLM